MSIEQIMFLIAGSGLTLLSLRLLIFFFKGGGVEIGMSPFRTRSLNPKAHATKQEQLQLVLSAIAFLLVGIALLYQSLSPLLNR